MICYYVQMPTNLYNRGCSPVEGPVERGLRNEKEIHFFLAWTKSRKSYCTTDVGVGVGFGVGGGFGVSKMLKFLR